MIFSEKIVFLCMFLVEAAPTGFSGDIPDYENNSRYLVMINSY
jgi:hypothetical protein